MYYVSSSLGAAAYSIHRGPFKLARHEKNQNQTTFVLVFAVISRNDKQQQQQQQQQQPETLDEVEEDKQTFAGLNFSDKSKEEAKKATGAVALSGLRIINLYMNIN